eukprot:1177597-Prorocentrum_minimum.AAC.2
MARMQLAARGENSSERIRRRIRRRHDANTRHICTTSSHVASARNEAQVHQNVASPDNPYSKGVPHVGGGAGLHPADKQKPKMAVPTVPIPAPKRRPPLQHRSGAARRDAENRNYPSASGPQWSVRPSLLLHCGPPGNLPVHYRFTIYIIFIITIIY